MARPRSLGSDPRSSIENTLNKCAYCYDVGPLEELGDCFALDAEMTFVGARPHRRTCRPSLWRDGPPSRNVPRYQDGFRGRGTCSRTSTSMPSRTRARGRPSIAHLVDVLHRQPGRQSEPHQHRLPTTTSSPATATTGDHPTPHRDSDRPQLNLGATRTTAEPRLTRTGPWKGSQGPPTSRRRARLRPKTSRPATTLRPGRRWRRACRTTRTGTGT